MYQAEPIVFCVMFRCEVVGVELPMKNIRVQGGDKSGEIGHQP